MIPAGYMAKRVIALPDYLPAERVSTIYSVSGCVSPDFADYIEFWRHNGYWLFDSPEVILEVARQHDIDVAGTILFFYEVFEQQYDAGTWTSFAPEPSFGTAVRVPDERQLEGYDVVTFYSQTSPECSPLSCNALAREVPTNSHCLFDSFEETRRLLENGTFHACEPGPYRIFAVYSVPWPTPPASDAT
jgi:hypothetical protein